MEPITAIARAGAATATSGTAALGGAAGTPKNFGAMLESALDDLSRVQNHAQTMAREFQAENSAVTLEGTMIAMQQSSLSFQAAVQVRNKLVTAYNEVMNMQV